MKSDHRPEGETAARKRGEPSAPARRTSLHTCLSFSYLVHLFSVMSDCRQERSVAAATGRGFSRIANLNGPGRKAGFENSESIWSVRSSRNQNQNLTAEDAKGRRGRRKSKSAGCVLKPLRMKHSNRVRGSLKGKENTASGL